MTRHYPENRDSSEYLAKKRHYDQFLTIYGRNSVLEALQADDVTVERLHVAQTARGAAIQRILALGKQHAAEVLRPPAEVVTRISKDGRQDQGVAADLRLSGYREAGSFLEKPPERFALLALDRVTTPRNVGMAIRSAAAGGVDGIIIPRKGCCRINPLVIKASAGTVFRSTILYCDRLDESLTGFLDAGAEICMLAGEGEENLFSFQPPGRVVYVLGGEGEGVGPAVRKLAAHALHIPMARGVESLNVAVAAALVAYRNSFSRESAR